MNERLGVGPQSSLKEDRLLLRDTERIEKGGPKEVKSLVVSLNLRASQEYGSGLPYAHAIYENYGMGLDALRLLHEEVDGWASTNKFLEDNWRDVQHVIMCAAEPVSGESEAPQQEYKGQVGFSAPAIYSKEE